MTPSIYFLPGHGGHITNGLGQELDRRGFFVLGRETVGDFNKLDFDVQAGDVITTGTWTDAWPLEKGQHWESLYKSPLRGLKLHVI